MLVMAGQALLLCAYGVRNRNKLKPVFSGYCWQCICLQYRCSVATCQSTRLPIRCGVAGNTVRNVSVYYGQYTDNHLLLHRVYSTSNHYNQTATCNSDVHLQALINARNMKSKLPLLTNSTLPLWYSPTFHLFVSNIYLSANANVPIRQLHTSSRLLVREESKVEQAVKTLKKQKEEEELEKQLGVGSTPSTGAVVPKEAKPPLRQRIVQELKHYYHGFKLLFYDIMVASKMCVAVLRGQSLTRRERKQFVRTVADLFRLVPFLVILIVPFMEFLLPVILKFFPNMLPSTFAEEDKEREKMRKRLKMKLQMAKFLQDTVEDMAVTRKGAKGELVGEFAAFMDRIRSSGGMVTNEEIMKYSKLFEDEITLDNMTYPQLRALCKLLEIPVFDVSPYLLRFQLQLKLRQLEADDIMIKKEGIGSLSIWELQEACRARGMRSFGVPEDRLKAQLSQWLELHLNQEIPTSLLLLSRALFMTEQLDTAVTLKQILTELPSSATEEAKVKYAEQSGDRIDNKAKLQVIMQEQEIIKSEKEEIRKAKEQAKAEEEQRKKQEQDRAIREKLVETVAGMTEILKAPGMVKSTKEVITKPLVDPKRVQIHSKDLGDVEGIFETVVETRAEMQTAEKELKTLKDDFIDYMDSMEELKAVVTVEDGRPVQQVNESKAARILGKKVNVMIGQIDNIIDEMNNERARMTQAIEAMEGKMQKSSELKADERQQITERITEHKRNLVSINDLLLSMKRIQKVTDDTKVEKIIEVLDNDRDGKIDVQDALKVIELIGQENVKLSREQVASIIELIRKEEQILQEEKEAKLKRKQEKALTNNQITPASQLKSDSESSTTSAPVETLSQTVMKPSTDEALEHERQEARRAAIRRVLKEVDPRKLEEWDRLAEKEKEEERARQFMKPQKNLEMKPAQMETTTKVEVVSNKPPLESTKKESVSHMASPNDKPPQKMK